LDPGPFFDPSVAGGAATGLLTGGIGEFTSSLGLAGRLPLNATAAFTGNFAGNSLTQAFKNGGLDDYDATEAMRSGIFGAAFSSGEGNVVRFAESAVAKETADLRESNRRRFDQLEQYIKKEFEALDAPDFTRRGAVSNEYIRIFKTLWTQEPATFSGEFYQFKELHCLPHPVQKPHPPIWIGGHSPAALRRAARYGDGWHPVGANPAVPLRPHELEVALGDLKHLTEAAGRDPEALTISYKAPLYDVSLTTERQAGLERRPFSGTTEQIAEDIATYGRLGVSELIFDFRSDSLSESLERMEHFTTVIKPAVVA